MIIDIQMALVVCAEVARPEVGDVEICVPLDVVCVGSLFHDVIHHTEHEILHLGVAEVEDELCAAASGDGLAVGVAYYPIGMFLV